jgi:hypothetical protein
MIMKPDLIAIVYTQPWGSPTIQVASGIYVKVRTRLETNRHTQTAALQRPSWRLPGPFLCTPVACARLLSAWIHVNRPTN